MTVAELKLVFAFIACLISLAVFYPYFIDIRDGKTKPHLYTWLIWAITQWVATVGAWHGGGRFSTVSLAFGAVLVTAVFFLSFRYGVKNITKTDTALLLVALLTTAIWLRGHDPHIAVLLVTAIDVLGYIPTVRKLNADPWSETISFWVGMAVANGLIIASISKYNILTVVYPLTILLANAAIFFFTFLMRRLSRQA